MASNNRPTRIWSRLVDSAHTQKVMHYATQKNSVPFKSLKADGLMESLNIRATIMTPTLLQIQGYRHGLIND
jgi:hypothetical protein